MTEVTITQRLPVINNQVVVPHTINERMTLTTALTVVADSYDKEIVNQKFGIFQTFDRFEGSTIDWQKQLRDAL